MMRTWANMLVRAVVVSVCCELCVSYCPLTVCAPRCLGGNNAVCMPQMCVLLLNVCAPDSCDVL